MVTPQSRQRRGTYSHVMACYDQDLIPAILGTYVKCARGFLLCKLHISQCHPTGVSLLPVSVHTLLPTNSVPGRIQSGLRERSDWPLIGLGTTDHQVCHLPGVIRKHLDIWTPPFQSLSEQDFDEHLAERDHQLMRHLFTFAVSVGADVQLPVKEPVISYCPFITTNVGSGCAASVMSGPSEAA